MRAIVTRPREDGTYDEVGMLNRRLTGSYKTRRGLLKYGIPVGWVGRLRVEIYHDSIHRPEPYQTLYIER